MRLMLKRGRRKKKVVNKMIKIMMMMLDNDGDYDYDEEEEQ